jgi:hypothetical protein
MEPTHSIVQFFDLKQLMASAPLLQSEILGLYFRAGALRVRIGNGPEQTVATAGGGMFVERTGDSMVGDLDMTGNDLLNVGSINGIKLPTPQVLHVSSSPGPAEFGSIKAAIDSITDNSATKPYVVLVGPGIYSEDPISMKSYVTVLAEGNGTVTIQPNNPNADLITIDGVNCRLQGITVRDVTGPSAAGIRVVSAEMTAILDIVTVTNCTEHIVLESNATQAMVALRNLRFISGAATKKFLRVQSLAGQVAAARIYSAVATDAVGTLFEAAFHVVGTGARLDSNTTLASSTAHVGDGVRLTDGGEFVSQSGSEFDGFNRGLFVENAGAASTVRTTTVMFRNSVTWDIRIEHPGATGAMLAAADLDARVFVDPSAPIKLFLTDPDPGHTTGTLVKGDFRQADRFDRTVNLSKVVREGTALGLSSGGSISVVSGLQVNVAAGDGFLNDPAEGFLKEVSWASSNLTLPANANKYIYADTNSVIQFADALPSFETVVPLGRVVTSVAGVRFVEKSRLNRNHISNKTESFLRSLGPIFTAGCLVTESGLNARRINLSNGSYSFGTHLFNPSGGSEVAWEAFYRDGSGGYSSVVGQNTFDNAFYDDGSGTLAAIPAGKYAAHTFYLVGDGADERYFVVYSQAAYNSEGEAIDAAQPVVPSFLSDAVSRIAKIVVRQGVTNILAVIDIRPRIGFAAPAGTSVTDHGNLTGLLDDDHPQYLLTSGTRAMTGPLNMGGQAITNVGTVDGTTVSAHAARHLPNGADAMATAAPPAALSATTANAVGIANSLSRSDHSHSILTGAPSAQTPDQSNAAGSSANLARADHVHNIPTAAPSVSLSATTANAQGTAATFARSDHGHTILTGVVSGQLPDQSNAAGSSANLARADHVHNIPTAAPISSLSATTTNDQGVVSAFARSDHSHAVLTGIVSSQTPDQANAAGSSANLARADHMHNIPTAAPSVSLSATTANAQGTAATFARSDHGHAVLTGIVSSQIPDQANAAGSSANLARADHVHNIPTAAPTTSLSASTSNSQGAASTFARSDHSHAVLTGTPVSTGTANATGSSANLARADHVHDAVLSRTEVKTDSSFATTSTTDVVVTGFTATPIAGVYLVLVNIRVSNSSTAVVSIYQNGSRVAHTERHVSFSVINTLGLMATQGILTVNGSEAVDVRVRTGGGTLTVTDRSLILVRLGAS